MGVVIRQSVKGSIAQYLGILIGYLNVLYILPYFLSPEENGLYRLLIETASFFALFAQVGIPNALPRFAPEFRANGKLPLLEKLSLVIPSVSIPFFFLIYFLFLRDPFNQEITQKSDLFLRFEWILLPLTIVLVYSNILENLLANHYRITISKIVREIGLRIGLAAACYLYFYFHLSYSEFLILINATYLLGLAALIFFFYKISKQDFNSFSLTSISSKTGIELLKYMSLIILSGIGTNLVSKVDIFMVSSRISLMDNAIYTTAFLITMLLDVPSRSFHQILAPIVSSALFEKNHRKIDWAYKKSSMVQTSLSVIILIFLILNAPWLYSTMPQGDIYAKGYFIIVLLGIAKIFDSITGINGLILANSKYYYVGLYFTFALAILAIVLNNVLIPVYGLTGVAVATAASIFLYNLGLTIFVWVKFHTHPFTQSSIHHLILAFGGIVVIIFQEFISYEIVFSLFLSLIYGILALIYLYKFRVIKELNLLIKRLFRTII